MSTEWEESFSQVSEIPISSWEKKIYSNKLNFHLSFNLSLMKVKFLSKKIMSGKRSSQIFFLGV